MRGSLPISSGLSLLLTFVASRVAGACGFTPFDPAHLFENNPVCPERQRPIESNTSRTKHKPVLALSSDRAMHIPSKMTSLYDKFILFGDSITQSADSQERGFAWAAALRDDYIRKLQVVNHGLSGYNTDQAVKVIDRIIPNPEYERVRMMTVFFGANDACWPTATNNQSVPLPQYTANMIKILTHPALKAHKTRLIIITPPPVNEYMTWANDQAKGYTISRRTAEHTKEYADAAREVGIDLGIPVVDLWTSIMLKAGWQPGDDELQGSRMLPENRVLIEMLRDGLHLAPAGYRVLYNDLLELIRKAYPDQAPDKLPFILPSWDSKEGWSNYKNVPNE